TVLQQHNLVVVSMEPVQESGILSGLSRLWEGISGKEFVIFTRQLAVMIEAKVPLTTSFKSIASQTPNPYFANILSQVLSDVDEGKSLSECLKRHPKVFSELFVNMVQSGEVSGNLQKTLEDLANNIEKNYILTQKIRGVLYYPAFILTAFFAVAFVMITFVIPKLMTMLKETHAQLPITTKILIWSGDFMQKWWWAILLAIIAAAVGVVYYLRTEDGKKEFDVVKLKIPLISRVLRFVYLSRFAENLSTLVRSGLPIVSALQITGKVIGSSQYEADILEAAESVKSGGSISETLSGRSNFPPMMVQMIKVGEDTGKLDSTLETMSKFYTREADQIVSNLSSILEPVLIVILGAGVGVLVFSIIIPIYNIAQGIK
ncbi:MAG: type II secretion system F family protein, partial [Candidatus Moranbacteria bacterium]|nr:type II secretion system F family protein [Candidatus Moranbacteria bacterium]